MSTEHWVVNDSRLEELSSLPIEELTARATGDTADATDALVYLWRSVLRPIVTKKARRTCTSLGHRGVLCPGDCHFAFSTAFNTAVKELTSVSYDRKKDPARSFEFRDPDARDQAQIRESRSCAIRDWRRSGDSDDSPEDLFMKSVNVAIKIGPFMEEVRRQWNSDRQTGTARIVQRIQIGSFGGGEDNPVFVAFRSTWAAVVSQLAGGTARQKELLDTIGTLEFENPTLNQLVRMLVLDYRDACDNTYSDVHLGIDGERLHRALKLTSERWFNDTDPQRTTDFFFLLESVLVAACESAGLVQPAWLTSFSNVRDVSRVLERPSSRRDINGTISIEKLVCEEYGWGGEAFGDGESMPGGMDDDWVSEDMSS